MSFTSRIIAGNATGIILTVLAIIVLNSKNEIWITVAIGASILIATSIVIGFLSSAAFKPLAAMINALEKAAGGDLSVRAEVGGNGDVIEFLQNWLVNHIQGVDKKYGPHLNKNGIK